MDNKLLEYIKNEESIGVTRDKIKDNLLNTGWKDQDIENAFKELENKNSSTENTKVGFIENINKNIDQYYLSFFLFQFFLLLISILLPLYICVMGFDSATPCNTVGKPLADFLFKVVDSVSIIPLILFFISIKEKNIKKIIFSLLSFVLALIIPVYTIISNIFSNSSSNFANFIPYYLINSLLIIVPFIPILLFLIIKRLFRNPLNNNKSYLNKGLLIVFTIIAIFAFINFFMAIYKGFLESVAQGKQISADKINSNYTHNPDNYSLIVDPNIEVYTNSVVVNSKVVNNYTYGSTRNLNPAAHPILFYGTSTSDLSFNCFANGYSVIDETKSLQFRIDNFELSDGDICHLNPHTKYYFQAGLEFIENSYNSYRFKKDDKIYTFTTK